MILPFRSILFLVLFQSIVVVTGREKTWKSSKKEGSSYYGKKKNNKSQKTKPLPPVLPPTDAPVVVPPTDAPITPPPTDAPVVPPTDAPVRDFDVICSAAEDGEGQAEIIDKYDVFPETDIRYGGINTLQDGYESPQLYANYYHTADANCPDDMALFCSEICESSPDCTAFIIGYMLQSDEGSHFEFMCETYNGNASNSPVFSLQKERLFLTSYISKANPIDPFVPSGYIPDVTNEALVEYVVPAFACIGFDKVDTCYNCMFDTSVECDQSVVNICTDGVLLGEGGSCSDICGPPACHDLVRRASLAVSGSDYFLDPSGYFYFGCVSRYIGTEPPADANLLYTCPE